VAIRRQALSSVGALMSGWQRGLYDEVRTQSSGIAASWPRTVCVGMSPQQSSFTVTVVTSRPFGDKPAITCAGSRGSVRTVLTLRPWANLRPALVDMPRLGISGSEYSWADKDGRRAAREC
jgi:hypothetical protein